MLKTRLLPTSTLLVLALLAGCSSGEPEQAAAPAAEQREPVLRSAAVAMPDRYGAAVAEEILRAGATPLMQASPPVSHLR